MRVTLTKVPGGLQVVIPDELAEAAGLREGEASAREFAHRLELWSPEFVDRKYAEMVAAITPDTLHGPRDGLDFGVTPPPHPGRAVS